MKENIERILQGLKNRKVGIFCDDSNLYHSYQKYGWRIDFGKFKEFIEKYCDLKFINYYVAIPDKSDHSFPGTVKFLKKMEQYVFLKKKKLKYTPVAGKFIKKGDVDIGIVLDVVRTVDNLDVVIVLSGDSDYLELKNYVVKDKNKKIIFMGYEENMAWELRQCWHFYLNRVKEVIAL